jgi:hypothetical protein
MQIYSNYVTRNYLLYNKIYVRNIFKMKKISFFKGNECKKSWKKKFMRRTWSLTKVMSLRFYMFFQDKIRRNIKKILTQGVSVYPHVFFDLMFISYKRKQTLSCKILHAFYMNCLSFRCKS